MASWPIAEQGHRYADFEIEVRPDNHTLNADGFILDIRAGLKHRLVYLNSAGRIISVRNASDPILAREGNGYRAPAADGA